MCSTSPSKHRHLKDEEPEAAFREVLVPLLGERETEAVIRRVFEHALGTDWRLAVRQGIPESVRPWLWEVLEALRKGRPLQYILGAVEFHGLTLSVDEWVMIPRPETEELVDRVIEGEKGRSPSILDIGTGSGCIALALKNALPLAQVTGLDHRVEIAELARRNADAMGLAVEFYGLDIMRATPEDLPYFDVIVSNPPYVTKEEGVELDPRVLDHEPHSALFTEGDDPVAFYRRIAHLGDAILRPEGRVYFELNEHYGGSTASLFREVGYDNVRIERDLSGKERFLTAKRP